MTLSLALALSVAIGVIAGLRSMTAPATVSWAARWGWLNLQNSYLAFLGSAPAAYILAALALAELVTDKLPSTPNRTTPVPLIGRILTGALSGSALCAAAKQSVIAGAIMGALGGIAGTFAGYEVRHRLVTKLHLPDLVVALAEDVLAIGGGFFIASRF